MKLQFGVIALSFSLLAGCEQSPSGLVIPNQTTGAVHFTASFPKSTTSKLTADPADVDRVTISATWLGGGTPNVQMTKVGPASYTLIMENLPASTPLDFHAEALDDGDVALFSGQVLGFVLAPDATEELTVDLLPTAPVSSDANPPKIVRVHKPIAPVLVGSLVPITVEVSDSDDSTLNFSFSTSAGQISPSSGDVTLVDQAASIGATLAAPMQAGVVQLTLRVSDQSGFSSQVITSITVIPVPPPIGDTGGVVTDVNFAPTILNIDSIQSADGTTIELLAHCADDQPTRQLTFAWVVNGGQPVNTNPASIQADTGVAAVSLTVADARGAAASIDFSLDTTTAQIIDLPFGNQPPALVGAFLSRQDVSYGDIVTASLYATDSEGAALTASWTSTWGTILSTHDSVEGSYSVHQANWTGGVDVGTTKLAATITDPQGAFVQYSFSINQITGQIPLTANAGADGTVFVGQSFNLDGSASTSADGRLTSYLWQQVSGPSSAIQTPTSAETVVVPTGVGTYVYKLTVTNINNAATDFVTVKVADPTLFNFVDAASDVSGVAYFLDTVNHLVHRYDLVNRQWLPSFDTIDAVACMAVARDASAIYVGIEGGRVDRIDPATGARQTFTQNSATVDKLVVADNYVFFQERVGSVTSHGLFRRTDGARTAYGTASYRSTGFIFSSVAGKVFQLRDGISPNDILQRPINQSNGTMGSLTDSPYHGDYSFSHPLRLFPDETKVITATGVFFGTSNLVYAGSLGTSYVDLVFVDDQPCIIKASGTNTQVLILNTDYSVARSEAVTGAPLRVFAWGNALMVFSTNGTNNIRVSIIDPVP